MTRHKARHAREVVAAVVAESRALAEDARDLVAVEYGVLPAVASPAAALKSGAPLVCQGTGVVDSRPSCGHTDLMPALGTRIRT